MPKKEGNNYVFTFPETSNISMVDVNDTGKIVAAVLNDPVNSNGKLIPGCGFHGSLDDAMKILREETGYGDKIKLKKLPHNEYIKSNPEGKELVEMFKWFNDYTFYGPESDRESAKHLGVPMTRFEDWAARSFKLETEKLE